MPWRKIPNCPEYQGVNWIHPLKQLQVYKIIEFTKDNFKGVTGLVVFGSSITNRCHCESDIDLYVLGDREGEFYVPADICDEYDVLWDKFMDRSDPLYNDIASEGVLVYGPILH